MASGEPKRIGLRHESKSEHEHRIPLVPSDLKDLLSVAPVNLLIQPSPTRCIPIEEFTALGATVDSDMSSCDIIMGVKEVPMEELLPSKAYIFFSHVIKGQPYNMPLLRRLMELRCTLFDYERLTNDQGARLVAFGRQAGQCGTINAFHSLNHRLAYLGHPNPFQRCKQAKDYPNFAAAKADLTAVGTDILANGLPDVLAPFVIGITGRGNVAGGVLDILSALPCAVEWTPAQMTENLQAGKFDFRHVYYVVLDAGDLYERADHPDPSTFTFAAFNAAPEAYVSAVPRHLPHFTLFINAVFWKDAFPRFITKDHLAELWAANQCRMLVIADITLDIEGSVEVTVKSMMPESPSYVYDPATRAVRDGFEGDGVVIMAVDILPAEQPTESSQAFSKALSPLMPELLKVDLGDPFPTAALTPVWRRACIVYQGALTPDYEYLRPALDAAGATTEAH